MSYWRVKHYFKKRLIFVPTIIFFLSLIIVYYEFYYALGFTVLSVGYFIIDTYIRPKSSEIDDIVKRETENITRNIITKYEVTSANAGTDSVIESNYLDESIKDRPCYHKTIRRILRTSNYEVRIFIFLSDMIIYRNVKFSIIEDLKVESSIEYYYTDIVSVRLDTEHINIKSSKQKSLLHKITITTRGSSIESIEFKDQNHIDQIINKLKTRLRLLKTDKEKQESVLNE